MIRDEITTDIFYNCGETKFSYIVSDFFNGPNYNLTVVEEEGKTFDGFFKFENQDLKVYQEANFNFT